MTKRDKVMDYYWLEFIKDSHPYIDLSTWHVDGRFWKWFYTKLSEGSVEAAKRKWQEALDA